MLLYLDTIINALLIMTVKCQVELTSDLPCEPYGLRYNVQQM